LGDAILESFPCFIVRVELAQAIEQAGLTGARLAEVETGPSDQYRLLFPEKTFPEFRWMQIDGRVGADDFAVDTKSILVVSERALELRRFSLNHAEIRDFAASGEAPTPR
jgi:hypothetical protein